MKHTILYDKHIGFNAKMVPFAGFIMPLQYTGITDEHTAVRTSVGVFDVSHMGEFTISGNDAENFLQLLTTNDIKKLSYGQAQYSTMCLEDGGIIDDLVIYRFEDHYMMVVNAANIESDFQWISNNIKGDVTLKDVSEETNLIAVQGPESGELLHGITDYNLSELKFYHFIETNVAGYPVVLSRTGYTGELGFELYVDGNTANKIWDALLNDGVKPAGLGARDALRLEMGYSLYGNDLSESITPLEANLGMFINLKRDYVGRDALKTQKEEGVKRILVPFKTTSRRSARKDFEVYQNDKKIGFVTSAAFSPILNVGIGLAMVDVNDFKDNSSFELRDKRGSIEANKTSLPFIQK